MTSYDGAKICELVRLFILKHLRKLFGNKNIGLYRDDGLAIIKNKSARLANKTRKELHNIFEQLGLKITAEANLHTVNFLEVSTLHLLNRDLIGSPMTIRYTYTSTPTTHLVFQGYCM